MSDLLKINVNEHTEKKNGLTYLSWAWAWAEVLKQDAEATWEPMMFGQPDGTNTICLYMGQTALVSVRVTIKGRVRQCLLPVMDHRNKAIPSPDAFAVNTAIMRCLAKAIAMHGLGLYIYAGEDLPEGEDDAINNPENLVPLLEQSIAQAKARREEELDERAMEMIEAFHGNEARKVAPDHGRCVKLWQDDAFFKSADERDHCWKQLRAESTLRALLQENARGVVKKPAIEMVALMPGLKKTARPITTEKTQ